MFPGPTIVAMVTKIWLFLHKISRNSVYTNADMLTFQNEKQGSVGGDAFEAPKVTRGEGNGERVSPSPAD